MGGFSKSINKRILHKGPNVGFCVICGEYGPLTRDHVPPKKCNNLNDVEIKALLPKGTTGARTTSQGGTHFKTLCKKCNSERLGIEYDPELVNLSNEITAMVLGAKGKYISLPQRIYPIIKPQRIARSIVGHVLAAVAVEEARTGLVSSPMSDALRDYFLDASLALPDNLEIYFWLYPSKKQVVIKGMGKSQLGITGAVVGHVFKFLPLGFWIVWDRPANIRMNIDNLVTNKEMGLNERVQLDLDLYNTPSVSFPEAPRDWEINALNDNYAFVGIPKN